VKAQSISATTLSVCVLILNIVTHSPQVLVVNVATTDPADLALWSSKPKLAAAGAAAADGSSSSSECEPWAPWALQVAVGADVAVQSGRRVEELPATGVAGLLLLLLLMLVGLGVAGFGAPEASSNAHTHATPDPTQHNTTHTNPHTRRCPSISPLRAVRPHLSHPRPGRNG